MADLPIAAAARIDLNEGAHRIASDGATVIVTRAEDYKSVVQILRQRLKECGLENKPKR